MRTVRVTNTRRGVEVARQAAVAETHWTRLRGLLGRPQLTAGEGLLIVPCRAVHTRGMRYPIDVVLLDDGDRVTAAYAGLEPGRRTPRHREARSVLELPAGTIAATDTRPGDRLEIAPCDRAAAEPGAPGAEEESS